MGYGSKSDDGDGAVHADHGVENGPSVAIESAVAKSPVTLITLKPQIGHSIGFQAPIRTQSAWSPSGAAGCQKMGTVETESAAVVAMVTWGGEIPVEMRRVRPVAKVENTEYLSSCPQVL